MTIEQQLRTKIATVLQTVSPTNAPTIYQLIQTQQGYKIVEELIIKKVCTTNLTISAAIPHLENEL